MTISEMIQVLQHQWALHGDVAVYFNYDHDDIPAKVVRFEPGSTEAELKEIEDAAPHLDFCKRPDRVIIDVA